MQKRSVDYWTDQIERQVVRNGLCSFIEEFGDGYELYISDEMNPYLVGESVVAEWDRLYTSQHERDYALHLYVKDRDLENITYYAVLYTNVETGENEYVDLCMDLNLRAALDRFIKVYISL